MSITRFERRRIKFEPLKFLAFTELDEVLLTNTQEVASPRGTNLTPVNTAAAHAVAIRLNGIASGLVMRDALASDA